MSTGMWTGVPLRTVLRACGVKRVSGDAQFLHFAGPAAQAPGKGSDGRVGMCLPLGVCLGTTCFIPPHKEFSQTMPSISRGVDWCAVYDARDGLPRQGLIVWTLALSR